jgi:hypothetical protein
MGDISIDQIKADLETARARAREASTRENNGEVKRLQRALGAALAEGAQPCARCGELPHGMEQPTAKGTEIEIGCLACHGVRVRAKTQRAAALLWNAGEFTP